MTFQISPNPCNDGTNCGSQETMPTLLIRGDLDTSAANTKFLGISGASLLVDGNVNLGSTSGLSELCATGNVTVGGVSTLKKVCTDQDLTVNDSANIDLAHVVGNIKMSSSGAVQSVISNGRTDITSGFISRLESTGNVSVSQQGRVEFLRSAGSVSWTTENAAASVYSNGDIESYFGVHSETILSSLGSISLSGTAKDINAMLNVALTPSVVGFGVEGFLRTNGDFSYRSGRSLVQQGEVAGSIAPPILSVLSPPVNVSTPSNGMPLNLIKVVVPTVNKISLSFLKVDVNFLSSQSNYAFRASDDGKIIVSVRDVNGVLSGEYYLGLYRSRGNSTSGVNRLCSQTSMETIANRRHPVCTDLNSGKIPAAICQSAGGSVPCISYATDTKTWTIEKAALPVGAFWFDGNLILKQSNYINTFMATGDILSTGASRLSAPNTSLETCISRTERNLDTTEIAQLYPTNFCDRVSVEGGRELWTPKVPASSLGNAVLVAGAYEGSNFSGGDITLETSQEIFGNVFAGDNIHINKNVANSRGAVVSMQGRLVASGQGGGKITNVFRSDVNFLIDELPITFQINRSPCMSAGCENAALTSAAITPETIMQPSIPASSATSACNSSAGCTSGRNSQVRVYWAASD